MDWKDFRDKFHPSWHDKVFKFIASQECNNIYTFLKSRRKKGREVAPKSNLLFRPFERPLNEIKVVMILDEPYSEKYNDVQYADGIPLSCEYVEKLHPKLNAFYDAMEKEFYDLNLKIFKKTDMNFLIKQGVLLLNSSFTVDIDHPGSHKGLWIPFMKYLLKNVFLKKNIPIIFCGEDVYEEYKDVVDTIYPFVVVKQPMSTVKVGVPWDVEDCFRRINRYLWDKTKYNEIMWVDMELPF